MYVDLLFMINCLGLTDVLVRLVVSTALLTHQHDMDISFAFSIYFVCAFSALVWSREFPYTYSMGEF